MKLYYYHLLANYLRIKILPGEPACEINPQNGLLFQNMNNTKGISFPEQAEVLVHLSPNYVVLNGNLHLERDILSFFKALHRHLKPATRIIIIYYSSLWKPIFILASRLGIRTRLPETNWLTTADITNFLELSGYEMISDESRVIAPLYIPLLSNFLNRWLAPLPLFNIFCMVHIMTAKPVQQVFSEKPSVSVVIPARNEAGNIEDAVNRIPTMGPDDEIIFVEGGSTDNTWETICDVKNRHENNKHIIIAQQVGTGKEDAVRKGFALASKEILMILDADLTVPPETLPQFYRAIVDGKGEFINGSRLVYPMENRSMRFLNMVGNKFFAIAFTFALNQTFKDTLCGTKVLTRDNYSKIAEHRGFWGDFDPFGDFDLIFGAVRMDLKVRELPIAYRERTYGDTNISRWRHGWLLLKMSYYALIKIKFV
ncbi:MAG: glycosyl transferase [Deltaproteobacteria bacterium CG06_land_8_20_14_3_00_44_19]|nr:MAG: glycosyl transferase [Deltaproteobacteria bacterium CG06_land_8_20_14_3_00_44_19]